MSEFGCLLLLTSDVPSDSALGQPTQALAAAIAESGIHPDSLVTGNDPGESVLVNRTLEQLGKLPGEIITDDRLCDAPVIREFYNDRIVPMLLQRQSVVIIARPPVTNLLRKLIDPEFTGMEPQEPILYRFDRDLNPIKDLRRRRASQAG